MEDIQNNVNNLQIVNNRVTADAALIVHLKNAIDSSFFISGAIDEDHNQLKVLRDDVQRTSVLYDELMTELDDKISREIQILNGERKYMKNLSQDIEVGKFGQRVSTPPTQSDSETSNDVQNQTTTKLKKLKVAPINYDNAILVIKFDDAGNFDYSTALFESISNALEQIPSAAFEVVAVSPTSGPSFAEKCKRPSLRGFFKDNVEMERSNGERVSITSSTSTFSSS